MRLLHFTNVSFTVEQLLARGEGIDTGGGWMAALLGQILRQTDHTLACASLGRASRIQTSPDDRLTCRVLHGRKAAGERGLGACRDLVAEWKPDLIHIHGTENAYGLLTARKLVNCPTVISLQGLLGPCSEWYRYFGSRSLLDVMRIHRWLEFPALRGQCWAYWNIRRRARREREIIRGNRFFMGRTTWDRAYLEALNPNASYYHEPRILREAFWLKQWQLEKAQRHRISFTNPNHPRKGVEVLLDAVKLLKPAFPQLEVALAGSLSNRNGYGRYVRCRIAELGNTVIQLGPLPAEQMAEELTKSHLFVSCSFIENNANAICEAQLLGMPVVSTHTGGVPSLVKEGQTGLFFPTGDAFMLAARIRELFGNDDVTVRLGQQAREEARRRHEPTAIVEAVLGAYKDVLSKSRSGK